MQANTKNGEVTKVHYLHIIKKNNVVRTDYSGGEIIKGHLLGIAAENEELDFYYQHITQKKIRVGVCHSVPHILENGKIELSEKWECLKNIDNKFNEK